MYDKFQIVLFSTNSNFYNRCLFLFGNVFHNSVYLLSANNYHFSMGNTRQNLKSYLFADVTVLQICVLPITIKLKGINVFGICDIHCLHMHMFIIIIGLTFISYLAKRINNEIFFSL